MITRTSSSEITLDDIKTTKAFESMFGHSVDIIAIDRKLLITELSSGEQRQLTISMSTNIRNNFHLTVREVALEGLPREFNAVKSALILSAEIIFVPLSNADFLELRFLANDCQVSAVWSWANVTCNSADVSFLFENWE